MNLVTNIARLFSLVLINLTWANYVQGFLGNSEITAQELFKNHNITAPKTSNVVSKMDKCPELLGKDLIEEISSYQPVVDTIIQAATEGIFKGRTYSELAKFVDKFGHRLTGSQNLEDSIDYVISKMGTDGYSKAWSEEAVVPHWIRGEESAHIIKPKMKKISILGIGMSIGTPAAGLIAEVLVVRGFDDLKANAANAKGKIVVFNQPWKSYSDSRPYRSYSANAASRAGAIAALVRSIGPFSLYTPHTGDLEYDSDVVHIPAACITIEDAELLDRMYFRNPNESITIHLKMLDYNMPFTTSRNVIGELTGSTYPDEMVIVSGHIDSWDVGQGALDNGGGCFISTEAIALLKNLGLTPKRSLQAILWTAEEVGLWGVQDYIRHHKADLHKIVAVFEADGGTFTPRGLDFAGHSDKAGCIINEILKLTKAINATLYSRYDSVGSDISCLIDEGVPGLSLNNVDDEYFFYHHTEADTMTLLNSEELDNGMALWAAAAYVIADLSIPLPRTVDE